MIMNYYLYFTCCLFLVSAAVLGNNYYVDDVASDGNGTFSNPFNNLESALEVAQPGDTLLILPGTHTLFGGKVNSVRGGTANARIVIRAFNFDDRPVLTKSGQIFEINHPYITIEGLIMDGQYGDGDIVQIESNADYTEIKSCEIRNGIRDGIEVEHADYVLIEGCEIHHLLAGSFNNQQDAHGIVAVGEQYLTIRMCNIYYVSGDCFQTDPNRALPLWDHVLVENSRLWTGPLPADAADWNAGEVPGENAIDTKINEDSVDTDYRPEIILRNIEAFGFEPGFIGNRSAFNIKNKVNCTMESILTYGNEIAFRLRGPDGGNEGGAHVTMMNVIAYDNDKVFRNEDGIELLHVYNCTFDKPAGGQYVQNTSGGYDENGFDMRNCLFVGEKPEDAEHPSNLSADLSFFMDADVADYRLAPNSPAIDVGVDIEVVTSDFAGNPRVSGSYDVGAYEAEPQTGQGSTTARPGQFELYGNFPNPFNPVTNIGFRISDFGFVTLKIYDIHGRLVQTLIDKDLAPGEYTVQWRGESDAGEEVASGVYFYRLQINDQAGMHQPPRISIRTKKMMLVR